MLKIPVYNYVLQQKFYRLVNTEYILAQAKKILVKKVINPSLHLPQSSLDLDETLFLQPF